MNKEQQNVERPQLLKLNFNMAILSNIRRVEIRLKRFGNGQILEALYKV